ncbi:transposase [Spirosoma sp. HMF4905]|uniref:Transposase n=1 Tax=Spirosoma arboris TaxID=2682092 RepID=A0A7K1SHU7_9BACT|nr:transposase [Spirosoma arboris]MVM33391.1 transposase [Spirosoma arboris]
MNQSFQELTDSQWQVIQLILNDKRKRWHSLRTIINAILWINYTGLQWRELDKMTDDKLPWLYVVNRKWTDAGEKRRDTFKYFVNAEKYDFSGVSALITA